MSEEWVEDLRWAAFRLWQHGMVEIAFSENGPDDDVIMLTPAAFDPGSIEKLSESDKQWLNEIVARYYSAPD